MFRTSTFIQDHPARRGDLNDDLQGESDGFNHQTKRMTQKPEYFWESSLLSPRSTRVEWHLLSARGHVRLQQLGQEVLLRHLCKTFYAEGNWKGVMLVAHFENYKKLKFQKHTLEGSTLEKFRTNRRINMSFPCADGSFQVRASDQFRQDPKHGKEHCREHRGATDDPDPAKQRTEQDDLGSQTRHWNFICCHHVQEVFVKNVAESLAKRKSA